MLTRMDGNQTDRLMTRAEVERRVGMGRSAIYRAMRDGDFPAPLRVGRSSVRWSLRELEEWIGTLPRSHGDGIHRASQLNRRRAEAAP